MKKTICDICGEEMKTTTNTTFKYTISRYGIKLDVCNTCGKELNEWIKNKGEPKGENNAK